MLVEALCSIARRPSPLIRKGVVITHLDPKVGAQQVVVVVSRVHGSAVLLIADEAAKPSSIRVPSQTTVGLGPQLVAGAAGRSGRHRMLVGVKCLGRRGVKLSLIHI